MASEYLSEDYPVRTEGVLCESGALIIGWPEPHEFDLITALRNRPSVRRWFLNDRLLDAEANRAWLETGMDRPKESLLSIRVKADGSFVGTIGWSDWDRRRATASFGRLALDTSGLRRATARLPHGHPGVALEAACTLRDFAFRSMRLERLHTYFLADNASAERVNRSVGMLRASRGIRLRADNTPVETVEMYMDRQRWERLQNGSEHSTK